MTDHDLNLACVVQFDTPFRENVITGVIERPITAWMRQGCKWEIYDPVHNIEQQKELAEKLNLPIEGVVEKVYAMKEDLFKRRTAQWRKNWLQTHPLPQPQPLL